MKRIRALLRPARRSFERARTGWSGYFGPVPSPGRWAFVVGCYNSGTTLLHDLIASHPEVSALPREGQNYTDQLVRPADLGLPRLWALEPQRFVMDENDDRVDVGRLKRQWGARYPNPHATVLLEKTTINAARTRWLQRHFDNARFIGIVRDGYAVCEGIRRKSGHDITLCARQWRVSNEVMLDQFAYLDNAMLTRYEDLTSDPAGTLKTVLEFLGLHAGPDDIEKREWAIHERTERIRNMNAESYERLTVEDIRLINAEASDMLHRFNYFRTA